MIYTPGKLQPSSAPTTGKLLCAGVVISLCGAPLLLQLLMLLPARPLRCRHGATVVVFHALIELTAATGPNGRVLAKFVYCVLRVGGLSILLS